PRSDAAYGVAMVAAVSLCRLASDKFDLRTIVVRIGSYEPASGAVREMRTGLSADDALRAFQAAMTTSQQHSAFYAVSHTTERWWSLASARTVGFTPVDDAADHGDYADLPTGHPQGGLYSTVEYSLDRMRTV